MPPVLLGTARFLELFISPFRPHRRKGEKARASPAIETVKTTARCVRPFRGLGGKRVMRIRFAHSVTHAGSAWLSNVHQAIAAHFGRIEFVESGDCDVLVFAFPDLSVRRRSALSVRPMPQPHRRGRRRGCAVLTLARRLGLGLPRRAAHQGDRRLPSVRRIKRWTCPGGRPHDDVDREIAVSAAETLFAAALALPVHPLPRPTRRRPAVA